MNDVSYERRSVTDIIEWLREKAVDLSDGRWTDFSSGDIGSVFIGLMAYLADMNNFQIDKTASELYLDTAVERSSILSLLKLIGYEPRHYYSAYTQVSLVTDETVTNNIIPRYSTFTNDTGSITYTALEDIYITQGVGYGTVFEGTRTVCNFNYNQITSDGKIYLQDYKVGINTVQLFISGLGNTDGEIKRCPDVRFITGEFLFSVHVDSNAQVYIQLPAYWTDLITESASIIVSYLITQGEAGRIGANILSEPGKGTNLANTYYITNPYKSSGGYFPETTDELKVNAPRQARTMETIVTKNDMKDLVMNLPDIASIKCGDYNDDWTDYVQPTPGPGGVVNDAYKALVLAVPMNINEGSLYHDLYEWKEVAKLHQDETYTGSDGTVIDYNSDVTEIELIQFRTTNYDNFNEVHQLYSIDDSTKDGEETDYRTVYQWTMYKEHQPTQTLIDLKAYIDDKRLASLYITYEDPIRKRPNILLYLYVENNDLRKDTIAEDVENFMKALYNREYCTPGRSLKGSVIGRDLHLAFTGLSYVEVNPPQYKIDVDEDEYIDMAYAKFKIYVNDELYVNEWDGD